MWLREHEGREWTGKVPKEPAPQRRQPGEAGLRTGGPGPLRTC